MSLISHSPEGQAPDSEAWACSAVEIPSTWKVAGRWIVGWLGSGTGGVHFVRILGVDFGFNTLGLRG